MEHADTLVATIIFREGHPNYNTLRLCGLVRTPSKFWNATSRLNTAYVIFLCARGKFYREKENFVTMALFKKLL